MLSTFTSRTVKRLAGAGAMLVLSTAGLAAAAPAANASGTGTACPTNRLCFYFNSNFAGARADFRYSDAGLGNELFTDGPYGRNGWGVVVNNNAASVKNRTGSPVILFNASDCRLTGDERRIEPGSNWNLDRLGLKNQVSSFVIGDGSACINRDQSSQ